MKIKNQSVELGVAVRDSNGVVLAIVVQRSMFQINSTDIEAEAISVDIKIAQNARYSPMIIESDSQEVVDLILSRKDSIKETSWIIADI